MRRDPFVFSHWHQLFEGFNTSSLDFYAELEGAIAARQIPEVSISRVTWSESGFFSAKREYLRIARRGFKFDICAAPFGSGFFFSWWLVRIPRFLEGILLFVALLGLPFFSVFVLFVLTSFMLTLILSPFVFIGSWIGAGLFFRFVPAIDDDLIVSTPLFGSFYERVFQPETYFNTDSRLMFQDTVHAAVLEVIGAVTSGQGVRLLSEAERLPQKGAPYGIDLRQAL